MLLLFLRRFQICIGNLSVLSSASPPRAKESANYFKGIAISKHGRDRATSLEVGFCRHGSREISRRLHDEVLLSSALGECGGLRGIMMLIGLGWMLDPNSDFLPK
ncbi:hypothetical protein BDZ45DRAFT_255393 [Acephala macrosclerotiorum]|nr:hypothetical protein BDZ45DRAFT_255393 [Acephala macrosclerotiorum]